MDGVENVLMSGNRAIVTVKPDYAPKKGDVRKAFSPKGLKLEDMDKLDIDKPVEGYLVKVKGST